MAIRLNLLIFSCEPDRTHWAIQPALSSSFIPCSVLVSLFSRGKKMSCRRLVCVLVVLASVFICVEPRVWGLEGSSHTDLFHSDQIAEMVFWPIIYSSSY